MDAHTLIRQFRQVVSLASLACVFSGIHTIQYSLLDHDMMDDSNLQESDSASYSGFTSTPDTISNPADTSNPGNTSSNSGKASGRWTDQEITLLLDYVETHCSLNTLRGLNLKKTQFNKVLNTDPSESERKSDCNIEQGEQKELGSNF